MQSATSVAASERVASIRQAVGSGRLASILAAVTESTAAAATVSSTRVFHGLTALSPVLRDPVAELAGVVAAADRSVRRAVGDADLGVLHTLASRMGASQAAGLPAAEPLSVSPVFEPSAGPPAPRTRGSDLAPPAAQAVDRALASVDLEGIAAAALLLAEAIDRILPRLLAAARSVGPLPSPPVEGCDLLDAGPVCVGGLGPNHYVGDRVLLVDLGGNDLYENSAGGGNGFDLGQDPVSVNIDLSGNDTYRATTLHSELGTHNPEQYVQGAGIAGIGILVDASGDDAYLQTLRPGPDAEDAVLLWGEAQGLGTLGGIGVLADLGGTDTYSMDATASRPSDDASLYGQGMGAIGGAGLLLDVGGDDDVYRLDAGAAGLRAGSTEGSVSGAAHSTQGQGYGAAATGVLIDEGGRDTFSMTSETAVPESYTGYDQFEPVFVPTGLAGGIGQGAGSTAGQGLLLTGRNATTYSMDVAGRGLAIHGIQVQGYGALGGVGVIDDLGGADFYTITSDMTSVAHGTLDEACGCVAATVSGLSGSTRQNVYGQGFGTFYAALGLIADHGGDDRYSTVAHSSLEAHASSVDPKTPAQASAVSIPSGPMMVQGAVYSGGTGLLWDGAGGDSYAADLRTRAEAVAAGAEGGQAEEFAYATWVQPFYVAAQGGGSGDIDGGHLEDLGGSDSYLATARSEAVAPSTPGGAVEGGGVAWFQGSGPNSSLIDLDGGLPDSFSVAPNFEDTCAGHRGEPQGWSECPVGGERPEPPTIAPNRPLGTGVVDSAPAKGQTSISFDPEQQVTGRSLETFPVSGVLLGPDGIPLADRPVEIRTQYRFTQSTYAAFQVPFWLDLTAVHAMTDASGRWHASLLAPGFDREQYPDALRLWAAFHGETLLRGTNVSLPFDVLAGPADRSETQ